MSDERTTPAAPAKTPRNRKGARKGAAASGVPETARDAQPVATGSGTPTVVTLQPFERTSMVAMAAYYRAERRQFAPGHELEDWLRAEQEVEALLRAKPARHDS